MVQEHRLAGSEEVAQASSWRARNGWKSLWTPATLTDKGTSGGTALLVKSWLGLFPPPSGHAIVPGRATHGIIQ
eukprot:1109388-Pyramimonas_sp.AAC.1